MRGCSRIDVPLSPFLPPVVTALPKATVAMRAATKKHEWRTFLSPYRLIENVAFRQMH
ncbi:hypothetical protein AAG906_018575 [Vitis piasezkii]|uniref:Uncharacterized protein n=1 Tax=Vitis vinifera TaxID=29760 RepID=A0A438F3V6_VITVI|nr:hypothetical protein CK203_071938 [Vitis vinifera]